MEGRLLTRRIPCYAGSVDNPEQVVMCLCIQHVHLSPDSMDEPGEALLAAIESAVQEVPAGVGGRLEVEKTNGELVGYLTLPSGVVDLSIQATSVPYAQDVVIPIRPKSRAAG